MLTATVKELSLYGCYLDSTSPMAVRSRVGVKIFGASEYFEASATVIYANPNLGVGLVFREVKAPFLSILQKWLLGAMQESHIEELDPERFAGDEACRDDSNQ